MYYQKSLNLERKGEIIALTGGAAGLLGILGGAFTQKNSSTGNSDVLVITSATLLIGGSIATIVGFSMYMTGASRVNRINKIQYAESFRLELFPDIMYCRQTQNYHSGITLRIRF